MMGLMTKTALGAGVLLLLAGVVATAQSNDDQMHAVQYTATWAPPNVKASTVQWGVSGNIRNVNAVVPPFDRKGSARTGQTAFLFVQLPHGEKHDSQSFWCSITVRGETKRSDGGDRECYVAVQI